MTHDFSKCKTNPGADGKRHLLDSGIDSVLVLVSAKGVKETNTTVTKLCNLVDIIICASQVLSGTHLVVYLRRNLFGRTC